MTDFRFTKFSEWGGISFLAGTAMAVCFAAFVPLPNLRGPEVITFLVYFLLAGAAYFLSVIRLDRDHLPIALIWGFALVFRLILLFTSPTLSDDVYRYIWDGHLFNNGINPYALPVNSPLLEAYDIPLRALVNNNWMASPYLPSAQLLFASLTRVASENVRIFQTSAVILDLLTGWLVMDILKLLGLPRRQVLIYLWNPLIILEFAHGAHIDSLMITLVMATFWILVKAKPGSLHENKLRSTSVLTLAGATLTKVVPVLLVPVVVRRWGWRRLSLYIAILLVITTLFTIGAGWGLTGPIDGNGLFGAIRIYTYYWNYNSGIYHWLEVWLTGYPTPGAVPPEAVEQGRILLAKSISMGLLGLSILATGLWAWRIDGPQGADHQTRNLRLLRLAVIPIGAYLLFSTTIHPWYVTLILPFLPFLLPRKDEIPISGRFMWPWLYFSIAVAFSYLTYLDPQNLREFAWVRNVEYLPFYGLLAWAALVGLWQSYSHQRNRVLL
jgi:alpha-1,6-mannosyltransferase